MDQAVARPPAVDARDDRRGRAEIAFARDPSGRTYIRRQFVSYPYHVCRPLILAGDPPGMVSLYLQSCAGGIFRNDRLTEHIVATEGAAAHVTTQGATIVHGMDTGMARQQVTIEAAAGSFVEVLPDPFILFPGARFTSDIRLRADAAATVVVADSFICHDPAGSGASFDWYHGSLAVEDAAGAVVARDRFKIDGGDVDAALPGITGRFVTQGALYILDRQRPVQALVDALRESVPTMDRIYAGASALPGDCGAWLRVIAADGVSLRAAMTGAWQAVRRLLTGMTPPPRRK